MNIFQLSKSLLIISISLLIHACDPPEAKTIPRPIIHNLPAVQGNGVDQLLTQINNERQKSGRPILTKSRRLTAAAKDHSLSMYQNNFFAHKGLDGKTFVTRMFRRGYPRTFCAENLVKTNHPSRAFVNWQNSPPHQKAMMNKAYTRVGIYRSGNYWTAIFAADDR